MTLAPLAPTPPQHAATRRLRVDRLGPDFGARILDVDLTAAGDDDLRAVRRALVEHKVLVFPRQDLDPDSQVALGRRLGDLTVGHPVVAGLDEQHQEIYALDSADGGFADIWHTDVTFMPRPPLGSILHAVHLPPSGGDTSWADTQLAYASLSPAVQQLCDGLTAVHDGNREWGYYLAQRRQGQGSMWEGKVVRSLVPVEHPVVRVHPETGRKGLFVNPGFTSHVVGVSDAESRAILDMLYAHITKPEHQVRHRWTQGDVVMWDNRSTLHYANRDYGTARRVMHRITLRGDEPVGPRAA